MDDAIINVLVSIPVFLLAIVVHEVAHGYVALRMGDDTAKRMGRLSLNPIAHIDLIGTVILPLILGLIGGMMFGWAKPVPVDSRNFKNIKSGIFWVSFAGPLANIAFAILSCILFAIIAVFVPRDFYLYIPFIKMLRVSITLNIVLAIFNLIPFPPLDGSKMISTMLSYNNLRKYEAIATYSFPIFIILMWTGALGYVIGPFIFLGEFFTNFLIRLFT